ncbi:hypothetical protein HK096_002329, partial [Nowakowskiella sp. JEL0078]
MTGIHFSELNQSLKFISRPRAGVGVNNFNSTIPPPPYQPTPVRRRPHFIGHILKSPAGAILHHHRNEMAHHFRLNHLAAHGSDGVNTEDFNPVTFPHRVLNDRLGDPALRRTVRREYKYSDDDVKRIVQMGRILTLKELERLTTDQAGAECGTELLDDSAMREKGVGIEDDEIVDDSKDNGLEYGLEYDPDVVDETFITGVHILERPDRKILKDKIPEQQNSYQKRPSKKVKKSRKEKDLPKTIQQSLRALRYALANPMSYWREESYTNTTLASRERTAGIKSPNLKPDRKSRNLDAEINDPFIRNISTKLNPINEDATIKKSISSQSLESASGYASESSASNNSAEVESGSENESTSALTYDASDSDSEWEKIRQMVSVGRAKRATHRKFTWEMPFKDESKVVGVPPNTPWEIENTSVLTGNSDMENKYANIKKIEEEAEKINKVIQRLQADPNENRFNHELDLDPESSKKVQNV